jgi:hypothetical protein
MKQGSLQIEQIPFRRNSTAMAARRGQRDTPPQEDEPDGLYSAPTDFVLSVAESSL